jgi:hypothetical protein
MRELAHRGGAATKRLAATEQNYYASIGRLGGRASVAARKAKIVAEVELQPADAPTGECAQASFPAAGPEAAAVRSQPIETGDGATRPLSENYANALRLGELLNELLGNASNESP